MLVHGASWWNSLRCVHAPECECWLWRKESEGEERGMKGGMKVSQRYLRRPRRCLLLEHRSHRHAASRVKKSSQEESEYSAKKLKLMLEK